MEKIFEKIANRLQPILPQDWNKVCLYAEIEEKSYEILFYCFVTGKEEPIQCYDLTDKYNIDEESIDETFDDINKYLKPAWKRLKENTKKEWSNYTLIFESNGRFKEEYDYTDLSEGRYEYKKLWKEKYLK